MRILVVAPEHHDLPNAVVEIAAIRRHHDAVPVVGTVRDDDIARAIEEGPFDIVWFVSHGSEEGVLLSDGMLSIDGVGQYLRASGASLCILNTCDSERVALSIIANGEADIICTIAPVGNRDAVRLGSLLAAELAETANYYEAYEIVAPEGGPYRYLKAKTHYRRRSDASQMTVQEIHRLLAGDGYGNPGLVATVRQQQAEIDKLKGEVRELVSDLTELQATVAERWGKGKIVLSPVVAFCGGLAIALLSIAVVVLLYMLARGGSLDGQIGLAVSGILSL